MNYPSPCDTCGKIDCGSPKLCSKYQAWINAWWKYFGGAFGRLRCYGTQAVSEKFIYQHPDRVRRYLENSPCESCTANEEQCLKPCQMYLRWYDARMKWHKWRLSR